MYVTIVDDIGRSV